MRKRNYPDISRRAGYGLISGLVLLAGTAGAVEKNIYYQIDAQSLDKALKQYAAQTDVQVVYSTETVGSRQAQAITGNYSPDEALSLLLDNSGLQFRFSSDDLIVVEVKNVAEPKSGSANSETHRKSSAKEIVLEEMIVTAQKREQSVKDVPISIVALGAAELENRGIGDLVELSMAVPGLFVEDNGSARTVYLRGVGNVAGVPMVGLYIDEMPITSFLSQGQMDTRLYDLDRVEVLRGPQGTLYGEGSMSGTVRFITKDPQLDQFGGQAKISASYTQDGSPSQKTQGVVNIPVIENELGFRIAGTFENSGGWIDQPAVSREDINDQEVANLRIKGLWRPSQTLELDATAIIHRNDAGAQSQSEDENGNYTQTFGLTSTPSWDDRYNLYNLTLTKDFGAVSLVSSSSYTETETSIQSEGRFFQLIPPPFPAFDTFNINSTKVAEAFNQEVRLSSTGEGALQWTVGAFYRDFELDSTGSTLFGLHIPGDPLPPASPYVSQWTSKSWAVFGDTSYALTDRFEVGVGLRYFEDDRDAFDGATLQTASFDSVNPRFYINYDLTDDIKVYSSVAKGFRSGGFNAVGQPTYDSDSLWTYELGSKMTLLDGRIDTEFALFYSVYKDLQLLGVPQPPAPPISILSNGGESEIKGVDLTLTWQTTDNLSLQVNTSLADTEVTEVNVSDSTFVTGDRLDFVPKYSFTVSTIYDFMLANKESFVRLDYNQRGRTLWTYRPLALFDTSDVINMLNFRFNLALNDKVDFAIFANNLLNDRDLMAPTDVTGFAARNRPRTIGVEINFDFE